MLLTLGIPTYNRSPMLRRTLTSLAKQIDLARLQDVEIVVSDNCSADDTAAVCAELAAQYPSVPLRYFRNDENIGFDRNVDALFHRSNATYVWTLSDDDDVCETAVLNVRQRLTERAVSFAFVNYDVSVDGKVLESRYGSGATCWINGRDLLKAICFSNSLISSSIFNREAWLASQPKRHVGTQWIHFFVAREVLLQGTALVIGEKMIRMVQSSLEKSRGAQRQEGSDQIEFYMQAHLKFVQYAHELKGFGYDKETCDLAQGIGQREDLFQIVNYKLTVTNYGPSQLVKIWRRLRQYRAATFRFWCVTTPLLFAPNGFVKYLRKISRIVRS
jgi:glycosyltransferase involved in cell wall biosynthesis